jgi:hypothetical protein
MEEAKAVFKAAAVGDAQTQAAHEEGFFAAVQVGVGVLRYGPC